MHKLLQRQLRQFLTDTEIPEEIKPLLAAISDTYYRSDQDRALLERSLELTSEELTSRYNLLQQQYRKIENNEAQLRLAGKVFDVSTQGILITDRNLHIIEVNQAYCDMFGYQEAQLLDTHPSLFNSPHHNQDFYKQIWHSLDIHGEWSGELLAVTSDGQPKANWLNISAIFDADGSLVNYVTMCSDITELKEAEAQLQKLAYYDQLTGLANRRLFHELIQLESHGLRRKTHNVALMYLDLDRFKYVNDSMGHPVGDQVLVEVANRLRFTLRETDIVARQGGDEFIIGLVQPGSRTEIGKVAEKLIDVLSQPYHHNDQAIYIGASIGICLMPEQTENLDEAMRNADAALYRAKDYGKGCFQFWDSRFSPQTRRRVKLESRLRTAIASDHLQLHYQPQVSSESQQVQALEALVRWQDPQEGIIMPGEFIPLAEETGLIGELGRWVIQHTCQQLRDWIDKGLKVVPVAVNVSPHEFLRTPLLQTISEALQAYNLPAHLLEVEITESSAMLDPETTRTIVERLRLMGVQSAIDDFGTGYSSLNYLKRFPVNKLKIDYSFVRDITTDSNDRDIANAIVNLGRSLLLEVVAEGVETKQQQQILTAMGCDSLQGYLISRPVPADQIEHMLSQALHTRQQDRNINFNPPRKQAP